MSNKSLVFRHKLLAYCRNLNSFKRKQDVYYKSKKNNYKSIHTHYKLNQHNTFIKSSLNFNSKDYNLIGSKPSKLSHIKLQSLFNWKFLKDDLTTSFLMLDSSNVTFKRTRSSIYWYKQSRFNRNRIYVNGFYITKLRWRRLSKNKILFPIRFPFISPIKNRYADNLKPAFRVKGVKKDVSLHFFKNKTFLHKSLSFTNTNNKVFKGSINLPDNLTTSQQNFFKKKRSNKSLSRITRPSQKRYKFRKLKKRYLKFKYLSTKELLPTVLNHLKSTKFVLPNTWKSNFSKMNSSLTYLTPINSFTFVNPRTFNLDAVYLHKYSPTKKYDINLSFINSLWTKSLTNNHVYSNMYMVSRHSLNLVFSNISMFLVSLNNLKTNRVEVNKYVWRKNIYSFIYPNEYRNNLFFRKKKLFFNSLFKNQSFYSSNFLSSRNPLYIPKLQNLTNNFNRIKSDKFTKSGILSKLNFSYDYKTNSNWFDYSIDMLNREMRIKRIRFKPGYQNIWRRVRGALKEYLGLKYIYQQQLTKYLSKFYVSSNKYLWGCSEMSIFRVFLYSRLLPDKSSFDLFWREKFIFINGVLPVNKNMILSPGDILQLVVSLNYYIMNKWLVAITRDRTSKFRRLIYKKGLSRKYKVIKQRKQKSYYTPTWIYKNRFDFSDVKNFLEVDYFTLSAVILYTPYLLNYHSYDHQLDLKTNTFRLYNW
jgi:hypothetical protein